MRLWASVRKCSLREKTCDKNSESKNYSFWFHLHCHSLFLGSLPLIRMTKRTKVLFVFEFFFCYEFSKITSDNQAKENYFLLCALFGFAFLVTRFIDLNAKKGKALSLSLFCYSLFFLFRPFCFRFIDLIHQSWIKPKTANDEKRKNKENFVTFFCISLIVLQMFLFVSFAFF